MTRICRLALVDDDAAVLDSFKFYFEAHGFDVETYSSARSYFRSWKRPRACLILDHHMPDMTGLDMVAHLRAEGDQTPVLLITSDFSSGVASRAHDLGVLEIFGKPVDEDRLLWVVRSLC